MTNELEEIRRQIDSLAKAKNARRYPPALQRRVTSYARMRIASGVSRAQISRELDVGEPTLERFLKEATTPQPGFDRVRVVARRDESVAPRALMVHGPCGTRVEGLSLNELAALFTRLACSA